MSSETEILITDELVETGAAAGYHAVYDKGKWSSCTHLGIVFWHRAIRAALHATAGEIAEQAVSRLTAERDEARAEVERLKSELAQSGNYIADHDFYPQRVEFANGRVVEVTSGYLAVSRLETSAPPPSPVTDDSLAGGEVAEKPAGEDELPPELKAIERALYDAVASEAAATGESVAELCERKIEMCRADKSPAPSPEDGEELGRISRSAHTESILESFANSGQSLCEREDEAHRASALAVANRIRDTEVRPLRERVERLEAAIKAHRETIPIHGNDRRCDSLLYSALSEGKQ